MMNSDVITWHSLSFYIESQMNNSDEDIGTLKQEIARLKKLNRKFEEDSCFWKQKYLNMEAQYNNLIKVLDNEAASPFLAHSKAKLKSQPDFIQEENSFFDSSKPNEAELTLEVDEKDQQRDSHNYSDQQQNMIQTGLDRRILSESNPRLKKSSFHVEIPGSKPNSRNKSHRNKSIEIPTMSKLDSVKESQSFGDSSPLRSPQFQKNGFSEEEIDFFSAEQIEKHSSLQSEESDSKQQLGLRLIEGYFVLEKIANFSQNSKSFNKWIQSADETTIQKERQLLDIVYRYTFADEDLLLIEDDPFESRKNQIKFGTPYEDLIYSFENFQSQQETQNSENSGGSKFLKKSLRKKFTHCLIRPQLIEKHGKFYQTEILYGFISPFPLSVFFQDLHRTIQQQIKFEFLESQKNSQTETQISKGQRVSFASRLMKEFYELGLQNKTCRNITNYPITVSIQAGVSVLSLNLESQEDLKRLQKDSLEAIIKKYNPQKVSKLLHYVLCEKQVLLVCGSRKGLNEVIEMIRLMIKPFSWVFPIVYRYSSHFQPFLSSPMPQIVGCVADFTKAEVKKFSNQMPQNDLITIFVDERPREGFMELFSSNKFKYVPEDEKEVENYRPDIDFLTKYLNKKSKSTFGERVHKYVNKLKNFIVTGKIEKELGEFTIDFIDTQMVQFFKDVIIDSNKKIEQASTQSPKKESIST